MLDDLPSLDCDSVRLPHINFCDTSRGRERVRTELYVIKGVGGNMVFLFLWKSIAMVDPAVSMVESTVDMVVDRTEQLIC